jgi:hypothetical protein
VMALHVVAVGIPSLPAGLYSASSLSFWNMGVLGRWCGFARAPRSVASTLSLWLIFDCANETSRTPSKSEKLIRFRPPCVQRKMQQYILPLKG